MKKYLIIIIAILNSSCIDNLLDQNATTKISTDIFWKTIEVAKEGTNSVYSSLRSTFGLIYKLDCYPYGDLLYFQNQNKQSITNDYWNKCYAAINRANNALDKIKKMQEETNIEEEIRKLKQFEGEVKFIRALHYFFLIDIYGDVQYLDHVPTQEEAYTISRSPITEVKNYILEDLDFASKNLPPTYTSDEDLGRATCLSAFAFKGKVELFWATWKKNGRPEIDGFTKDNNEALEYYQKAIDDFKEVMNPKYGLTLFKDGDPGEYKNPNYLQLFDVKNEKCSEIIFAIQYGGPNIGQGEELVKFFGNRSVLNGWANVQPTNYLVNLYQSTETGGYCDPIIQSKDESLFNGAANPESYKKRDWRMRGTIVWNDEKMVTISVDGMNLGDSLSFWFGNKNGYLDYNDSKTGYMFRKFVRQYSGFSRSNGPQDFYLMRLPDVWLMYCEAMNEINNGPTPELFAYIDKIRHRGNLPPLDQTKFNNYTSFFNAIVQERAIEFVAEGIRFFDIRRWRIAEEIWDYPNGRELRSTLGDFIQDQYKNPTDRTFPQYYIYNIPEQERIHNPNLTQNTPWL